MFPSLCRYNMCHYIENKNLVQISDHKIFQGFLIILSAGPEKHIDFLRGPVVFQLLHTLCSLLKMKLRSHFYKAKLVLRYTGLLFRACLSYLPLHKPKK